MGELAVGSADRSWRGVQIGSRRARILLALLALEPGRIVTMDSIVETLWSREPPKRPEANVATLVSRLRATLDSQVIQGGQYGYRLTENVSTDLAGAGRLVETAGANSAQGDHASARTAADGALGLMHDDVLPEFVDEPWVMPTRRLRQRLVRQARHLGCEAALAAGEPAAALALAEAALAVDPLDEAACRLVMRVFQTMGEPVRALRAYLELHEVLVRELGVTPAESTEQLYLSILRQ